MNPTTLRYLENFNLLTDEAKVVAALKEEGRDIVILDQTIFYPQGGGQPYDQGMIVSKNAEFLVEEVRFEAGLVRHIGKFQNGLFMSGEMVTCYVNRDRRLLYSRLHSAGHIVDLAVSTYELPWIPGKGYHFPDGPYVEYAGNLEGVDKEKIKVDLEILCNKFIAEARPTTLLFLPKEQLNTVCTFVPDYIPEGKPARVVLFGNFGIPCGGTHVNNLSEINKMTIRKIKQNGANTVRVGYDVVR